MDNEILVLSNKPLIESETTVTLDILSNDEGRRGETLEVKEREGKITFNPKGFRIFSLPDSGSTVSQPGMLLDRTKWDLYLIVMPFTLHEPANNTYYQKVEFRVILPDQQDALAFDLFPKNVSSTREETRNYTLSPDIKFQEIEVSLGQIQRTIHFESIRPTIRAFGVGESSFYWIHTGFEEQKEVIPETKHALIVLQVPRGTKSVDGAIWYQVTIAKKLVGRWKNRACDLISHPIHWELHDVIPFFGPKDPSQTTKASTGVPHGEATGAPVSRSHTYVDACIVCALAEEAEAVISEITTLCGVTFQQAFSSRTRREYRHATISNKQGERLTLHVSCLPNYGPLETGLHLKPILEEFNPRFAAMTGICAGDKRKVGLGDIVVAERAFAYDVGKIVSGDDGRPEHLRDTATQHPHPDILQFARMFGGWKAEVAGLPRPASLHQQRDWLLNTLLAEKTPRVDDIEEQELEQFAPDWRRIVSELQSGPQPYLSPARALLDKSRIYELRFGREKFPFKDEPAPKLHIEPMASGNTVRADNPFDAIRVPVRGTVAIDMEGAAFYRTMADFSGIRSLLVKGVCDYADSSKDDSYHHYASRVSARYVLSFLREYLTSGLMPR
ncbi:MAG TPA: hypothetical protein VKR06_19580 [Ktedonosporobacter sp.]|nr:hypothetical protein [Ktedonosporobacter sp.]